jgi:hypothetical protein
MSSNNSEIERAWQYLRSQQAKQLPLLAVYGKKYKKYISGDEDTLTTIQEYRSQLKLFSVELLDIIEFLVELDFINQLKKHNQDYSTVSQRLRHFYDERFWYVQSYKMLSNNFSTFIYWLDYFVNQSKQINSLANFERKQRTLIAFKLAFTMYEKYFQQKTFIH